MREIGININENNQVIVAYADDINGDIRLEITDLIFDSIFNKSIPYKYENGILVVDENKQLTEEKENLINDLKQKLVDTDYIVTKSMEYQLTGKTIPTSYNQILFDRDSWRKQINNLQSEIKEST